MTLTRLGPWVWFDGTALHVAITPMLRHLAIADTPENRAVCTAFLADQLRDHFPHAAIIEQDEGPDG